MSTVPAFWARNFDDFDTARQRFEDILRAFREQGDEATASGVLTHLARIEAMTGHMDRARALAAEALDLAEQTEQETYLHMALCAKGHVCAQAGELAEARAAAGRCWTGSTAHPDVVLEGMARAVLGLVALSAGDLAEADRQLTRADEIEEWSHNREPATNRFHGRPCRGGHRARRPRPRRGCWSSGWKHAATALPRPWILAVSARSRGLLNAARGDLEPGPGRLPAGAGGARGPGHARRARPDAARRWAGCTGAATSGSAPRNAWAGPCGCSTPAGPPLWAAVARDELGRARGRRGSAERLTPTERQIAELAVSGLRNSEIAARLFLSGKTVEANLSRVYRKLGVRSRTELAAKMPAQGTAAGPQP